MEPIVSYLTGIRNKTCSISQSAFTYRLLLSIATPPSPFALCSAMGSCSTPLSSPLSPPLGTLKPLAPLSYPRSGGPSYAVHYHTKRGIRFSQPPLCPKLLCAPDFDKGIFHFFLQPSILNLGGFLFWFWSLGLPLFLLFFPSFLFF